MAEKLVCQGCCGTGINSRPAQGWGPDCPFCGGEGHHDPIVPLSSYGGFEFEREDEDDGEPPAQPDPKGEV